MASTIQVVLQQDVANLGKSGELVRVRPGYARNYLIPRSFAVSASERNIARIEHEQRQSVARAEKAKSEAAAAAQKVAGVTVTIERRAGEENRLFGSVTAKDVEQALLAKGIEVDRKKLHIEAIRSLGTYEASVKFVGEISANFKVEVVAKK